MESKGAAIYIIVLCILIVFVCAYSIAPGFRAGINQMFFDVQKADDATSYETLKQVEDTARAMMASYTADKLTYEQYKSAESAEQRSWADMAKMRANKTAASYNEFILKNSFVWQGGVPDDIASSVEYIQ